MKRNRMNAMALLTIAGAGAGGCVGAHEKAPVARHQQEATMRLAEIYAQDLAALNRLAHALFQIHEQSARVAIEASILNRYVLGDGEADVEALRRAAAAPSSPDGDADPLLSEVRKGRMTIDEAAAWLEDFALAWRLHAGVETRTALLAQLKPIEAIEAARADLAASLDQRSTSMARLAADALASGTVLTQARALEREFMDPSKAALERFWRDTVLADVRDPESRRLLESILIDVAPAFALDTETSR